MDKKFDKSKLVEFLVYPIGFCRNSAGGDLSAKRRRKRLARTNKIVGFSTKYTKKTTLAGVAFLVYPIGFEPTAPSVGGLCSIQLSYGYVFFFSRLHKALLLYCFFSLLASVF